MKKSIVVFGVCLVSLACQKDQQAGTSQTPSPVAGAGEQYVITSFTTLRISPTNETVVQHPLNAVGTINNWRGVLRRGQSVTVTDMRPGWFAVTVQNGGQGWVSTDNLLNVKKIQQATVLAPTPAYPANSTTVPPGGIVQAGDLLFVLQQQGDMTQVQADGAGVAWVVTSSLTQDPVEVGMANLIIEAKEAAMRRDMDEAGEALDEARMKYPNSQLMQVVADQVDLVRMHATPYIPTAYFQQGAQTHMQPSMLTLPAGAAQAQGGNMAGAAAANANGTTAEAQ